MSDYDGEPRLPQQRADSMNKHILDVTCGGRSIWFTKNNPDVLYCDTRDETLILCDGRTYTISPDVVADFRDLPFNNDSFSLVVFDPPHCLRAGENSWLVKKYGKLTKNWRDDIARGFTECFRVLKPYGVLIFKWAETDIKLKQILELSPYPPLFGTTANGKHTWWIAFMKPDDPYSAR